MNEKIDISANVTRILLGANAGQPAILELAGASNYYLDWLVWEATAEGKIEVCYGPLPDEGDTLPSTFGMFLVSRSRVGGVYSSSSDINVSGCKCPGMTTEEVESISRFIRWRPTRTVGVIGIAMKWLST